MATVINRAILSQNGITSTDFIYMLIMANPLDYTEQAFRDKFEKLGLLQYGNIAGKKIPLFTDKGVKLYEKVSLQLTTANTSLIKTEKVDALVKKILELFPEGKKYGTPYYWRCGSKELAVRLMSFFNKYGSYDEEKILKATDKYIKSFNGDYRFMKLAKYFVWKKEEDGSESSELATQLENLNVVDSNNDNWTQNIV
jgi:hypothetical protein